MDEIAFAFYVRMLDQNPENFDEAAVQKSITGLANNLPHLLPNPYLSGRDKLKAFQKLGHPRPKGLFLRDLPIAETSPRAHEYVIRYAKKLACALFYREQHRPASASHKVWAIWGQAADKRQWPMFNSTASITPIITVGGRTNVHFGDQFLYRFNHSYSPDIMLSFIQFGRGFNITSIVSESEFAEQLPPLGEWTAVSSIYPRTA